MYSAFSAHATATLQRELRRESPIWATNERRFAASHEVLRSFLPTNEKSKTHVALNLMFLKVLYARAFTRGRACEGKGKRKGRRKEKEKVRACSAHQGRTSASKSYSMRERSDVYAPEVSEARARMQKERKQRAPQA